MAGTGAPAHVKDTRPTEAGRQAGRSWLVDETYVKVERRWCYLYRASDSDGNLVETMLSKTRDMLAAIRCTLRWWNKEDHTLDTESPNVWIGYILFDTIWRPTYTCRGYRAPVAARAQG